MGDEKSNAASNSFCEAPERFQLQFRAESFNLTNTPVFSAPGATINGANFGIITGQSNPPRNIQLALRLVF
jgi:hypothetical protein